MADFKDIVSDTLSSLADKARDLAGSGPVKDAVGKIRETAESSGVAGVYAQGAERAKAYARIAKLRFELNGQNTELGRVYAEIGRQYFEENRGRGQGIFVPLFSQAERITEEIHAKQEEIDALKSAAEAARTEPDISVEIDDFEQIVNATEADGTQVGPDDGPQA